MGRGKVRPQARRLLLRHPPPPSHTPYTKQELELAYLQGLLNWFKWDFMKWCNKPACSNPQCSGRGPSIENVGVQAPTEEERIHGHAGRTEVYKCKECDTITRFPRYNDPKKLLETRLGRCGEWANCFCLICRALGIDARYVMDWTDHVWVEIWIESLGRYAYNFIYIYVCVCICIAFFNEIMYFITV